MSNYLEDRVPLFKIKAIVSLNIAKVISVTLFSVILLSLLGNVFSFIPEIAHLKMNYHSRSEEVKAVILCCCQGMLISKRKVPNFSSHS